MTITVYSHEDPKFLFSCSICRHAPPDLKERSVLAVVTAFCGQVEHLSVEGKTVYFLSGDSPFYASITVRNSVEAQMWAEKTTAALKHNNAA